MTIIVTGLPVIVEIHDTDGPSAFWWQNRRHIIAEYVCHWDDIYSTSEHWLVVTEDEQPVSLIYDRAAEEWFIEWVEK